MNAIGADLAFAVDLDHLDEVLGDLAACDRAFAGLLGDLDRVVAGLHVHWTGQAADGHAAAQAEWRAGFAQMREALGGLHDRGATCRSNYDAAAAANLEVWGR